MCYVLKGNRPEMDMEMTLRVAWRGVVARAEVTMDVRGIDPIPLTLKLESLGSSPSSLP